MYVCDVSRVDGDFDLDLRDTGYIRFTFGHMIDSI